MALKFPGFCFGYLGGLIMAGFCSVFEDWVIDDGDLWVRVTTCCGG